MKTTPIHSATMVALVMTVLAFTGMLTTTGEVLSPWGVCAHLPRGDEYPALIEELDLMQQAGITWARADWSWGAIEPQDDVFQFERFDRVVTEAQRRNIQVLPILCYNTSWAGFAHENLAAWTNYVETTVRRYADRLPYWEVWNEPNIHFWKPQPDAAQYTELLKATHQVIKGIDPKLQVVYGGTAGIPLDYIGQTLEHGAAGYFDVLAVHPYCYPGSVKSSSRSDEYQKLIALLRRHQAPERVWITEMGWPTHQGVRGINRTLQGERLTEACRFWLARGVEVLCWYEFRDGGEKADYNEHNFGLIDKDLVPKPAYQAYRELIRSTPKLTPP